MSESVSGVDRGGTDGEANGDAGPDYREPAPDERVEITEAVESAGRLTSTLARCSVNVAPGLDEDEFFPPHEGNETLVALDVREELVLVEPRSHVDRATGERAGQTPR